MHGITRASFCHWKEIWRDGCGKAERMRTGVDDFEAVRASKIIRSQLTIWLGGFGNAGGELSWLAAPKHEAEYCNHLETAEFYKFQ